MSKRSSRNRGTEVLSLDNVLRTIGRAGANASFIRRMPFSERNLFPRTFAAVTAVLFLTALPVLAKKTPNVRPKTTYLKTATIENSGSTNTFGYKIFLTLTKGTYHATVISNGGKDIDHETGMPGDVFPEEQQFFTDLDNAMPLTSLAVRHGMRSASFGTQTFVIYKGQKSPDLTFGGDAKTAALKADVDAIIQALHIHNTPRHPMMPLPQMIVH